MRQAFKSNLLLFFSAFIAITLTAQQPNPFRSIGKQSEIIDVSHGKYTEIIEKDSLERVGTVLVNRYTRKIERFLDEDSLTEVVVDNTAQSRFFSIDPLTKAFPELSPYQYASNRPIDGIDLDGKEWTKTVTYDPLTSKTNVHFEVKLKVVNEGKTFKDAQALKAEIQQQFSEAFKDAASKETNTTYSASINVELVDELGKDDFGVLVTDGVKPKPGSRAVAAFTTKVNTKNNIFLAHGSKFVGNEEQVKSAQNVAQDIVHEILHTAGVVHPQDDENTAQDVDLVKTYDNNKKFVAYVLGSKANLTAIIHNILIYGEVKINGKKVSELEPDINKRSKASGNQSDIIYQQIEKDEKKQKK